MWLYMKIWLCILSTTHVSNDTGYSEIDLAGRRRIAVRSCVAAVVRSMEPGTGMTTLVGNQAMMSAILSTCVLFTHTR